LCFLGTGAEGGDMPFDLLLWALKPCLQLQLYVDLCGMLTDMDSQQHFPLDGGRIRQDG
jgi:hypothetical protein